MADQQSRTKRPEMDPETFFLGDNLRTDMCLSRSPGGQDYFTEAIEGLLRSCEVR